MGSLLSLCWSSGGQTDERSGGTKIHKGSLEMASKQICAQLDDQPLTALPLIEHPHVRRVLLPRAERNNENLKLGSAVFVRWRAKPSSFLSCFEFCGSRADESSCALDTEKGLDYSRPLCVPLSEKLFITADENLQANTGRVPGLVLPCRERQMGQIEFAQILDDKKSRDSDILAINFFARSRTVEKFGIKELKVLEVDMEQFFEYVRCNDVKIASIEGSPIMNSHIGVISKIYTTNVQVNYEVSEFDNYFFDFKSVNLKELSRDKLDPKKRSVAELKSELLTKHYLNSSLGNLNAKLSMSVDRSRDNTLIDASPCSKKIAHKDTKKEDDVEVCDANPSPNSQQDIQNEAKESMRLLRVLPANSILAYEVIILPVSPQNTLMLSNSYHYSIHHLINKLLRIFDENRDDEIFTATLRQLHNFFIDHLLNGYKHIDKLLKKIKERKLASLLHIAMHIDELKAMKLDFSHLDEIIKDVFAFDCGKELTKSSIDFLFLISELNRDEILMLRYQLTHNPAQINSFEKLLQFVSKMIYEYDLTS